MPLLDPDASIVLILLRKLLNSKMSKDLNEFLIILEVMMHEAMCMHVYVLYIVTNHDTQYFNYIPLSDLYIYIQHRL